MKKSCAFILMVLFSTVAFTAKIATFPRLMNPEAIIVDNQQIFIVEGIHLFIYSAKDFKLQVKIGKEGEGPREFKKHNRAFLTNLQVYIQPDRIFISSLGKISFFTREGTFIKEIISTSPTGRCAPLGEKYAGLGFARTEKAEFVIFKIYEDPAKQGKEIRRFKIPEVPGKKIDPVKMVLANNAFVIYKDGDRLFMPDQEDGTIHVFDENARECHTITYQYPKVKIADSIEKKLDRLFSRDHRFKDLYLRDKARNNIRFASYFPPIKALRISDQKVYVITFNQKDEKYESFIFGIKGKLLKKIFLPLAEKNLLEFYPFTVYKGKFYQLIENEDKEEWELHIMKIK